MNSSALRVVARIGCALFFRATVHAADYFPPPDNAGGWRTATTSAPVRELAAIDLPRLDQAWEFTQRCTQNAGLLVVRNGYHFFEKYGGRASRNVNPDMASEKTPRH